MVALTPEMVSQTYANHLDWYPPIKTTEKKTRAISGLNEIVEDFDLILLDSYGVLCRGATPIEGAFEAIRTVRRLNKAFLVVSNDTTTNRKNAVVKYQKRGFDFSQDDILTSLDITERFLKDMPHSEQCGVIAPDDHPSNALLTSMIRLNQCGGDIPEGVTTLLFLTGSGWTATMHEKLVASAQGRQFHLLLGNPDVGVPNGNGIIATPGYFLADFSQRTQQRSQPVLFGKPNPVIFSAALALSKGILPERVLMVGDTLYTDILGGNGMGFSTLLLQSGIYQGQDIDNHIRRTGITPDFIAPSLWHH